ncbi:MAG: hypothetical protein ABII90_03635 [Bacteroidota bacterium]
MSNYEVLRLEAEVMELENQLVRRGQESVMSALDAEFDKAVYGLGIPYYANVEGITCPANNRPATFQIDFNLDYTFYAKYIMCHLMDTITKTVIRKTSVTETPLTIKIYAPADQLEIIDGNVLVKHFLSDARHPYILHKTMDFPKGSNCNVDIINNSATEYLIDFTLVGILRK